ncbi:MAG: hypothetical protein FWE15_17610 [Actinomycetia bacterium]|nr:hypothetical protein [Actinomycetes bacterium]
MNGEHENHENHEKHGGHGENGDELPADSVEALELALNPLVFRIADSMVLIGVRATDRGPELMYTEVGDTVCAVAYTDPEEIRSDLPDGYRLFQIGVPDLLRRLHPECGLLIGPRAASPLMVMPYERDAVIAASVPFPVGAPIRIKKHGVPHRALMKAVLPRITAAPGVLRVYLTRYQVADAREKLLVVYENDPAVAGADADAANAFIEAAAEIEMADPMQVVALDDVPEPFHAMVLDDVPPVYVRSELTR